MKLAPKKMISLLNINLNINMNHRLTHLYATDGAGAGVTIKYQKDGNMIVNDELKQQIKLDLFQRGNNYYSIGFNIKNEYILEFTKQGEDWFDIGIYYDIETCEDDERDILYKLKNQDEFDQFWNKYMIIQKSE
jgi:hypothetical protein